jgi:hypothetical protein
MSIAILIIAIVIVFLLVLIVKIQKIQAKNQVKIAELLKQIINKTK